MSDIMQRLSDTLTITTDIGKSATGFSATNGVLLVYEESEINVGYPYT